MSGGAGGAPALWLVLALLLPAAAPGRIADAGTGAPGVATGAAAGPGPGATADTASGAARGVDLAVEPSEVGIGLGYHGARVRVRATVPEGHEVVFVLAGPEEPVRLKVKDRVLGLLWASVGEIRLESAPTLLLAHAWPRTPPREVLAAAGLTDRALEARSLPPGAGPAERAAFDEMLKLLRHEGRLAVEQAGRRLADGRVETEFRLPAGMPVGACLVSAALFRDGVEVGRRSAPLTVRKVGPVAWLSRLALEEGLLYGLGAVVLAVLAGLLTGYIFGRGRSGAH